MNKSTIYQALRRLGELAESEGLILEITIYGGVAMMLNFDSRVVTKDVDAILRPHEEGVRLAERVGRELGLSEGWLEDNVRLFLSNELVERESRIAPLALPKELKNLPGLRFTVPSPRYLIAMKSRSLRRSLPGVEGDRDDLIVLFRHENIRSADTVEEILEAYFLDYLLDDRARHTVETLITRAHSADA